MTIRYRVSFRAFPDFKKKGQEIIPDQKEASYEVCTLKGANKAVAMAAGAHFSSNNKWAIFEVTPEALEGDSPQGHDLVDRMEW